MVSIYDVEPRKLIEQAAIELKKMPEMAPPEWAAYVKTGMHKERPPVNPDWWYIRSASILRTIYKFGPIGVSKLRTKYGGRKNRGHKPDAFRLASGNVLRKVLQQLEKAGLLKQAVKGVHKGRVATPKGIALLDQSAVKIYAPKASPQKRQQPTEKPVAEATQ